MRFKRGLVVGKFCPLHDGHRLLIDTARAACDEVVILSYAKPGFEGYEASKRAAWLEALYPDAIRLVVDDAWLISEVQKIRDMPYKATPHDDAPEIEHRRFCAWLCEHYLGGAVQAVFTSEAYGDGFAAALTVEFRKADAGMPDVAHICVDAAREQVPVSGTMLRADLYKYRAHMPANVYTSLIKRVALLGGESTGKSTLAKALAQNLNTEYVCEYGRDLWAAKNGNLVFEDYLHIAQTQISWEEDAALKADTFLVCDTTPLTTMFYSDAYCGRVDPVLIQLANRHYDYVFLCGADFEFVQDGWRADEAFRMRQQIWYRERLAEAGVPYHTLNGSVSERIAKAISVLTNEPVGA